MKAVVRVVSSMVFAASCLCAAALHGQGAEGAVDRPISSGWEFHALNATGRPDLASWRSAGVPGVVPTDLLAHKLIDDPYFRDNERKLQWVGLTDWEYRTTINMTPSQLAHKHLELVFDGLDTFAEVSVNGRPVLHADNMFRTWRVDVKPLLHAGDNQVTVVLRSAVETMLPKVKAMAVKLPTVAQIVPVSEDGVPTDPYVRKAPYSYGWDWGPRFVNEGIWKPVHLVTWDDVRVDALTIRENHVDAEVALLEAVVKVQADHAMQVTVSASGALLPEPGIDLRGDGPVNASRSVRLVPGSNDVVLPVEVEKPQLWWPLGYGRQSRYGFTASVSTGALTLGNIATRTGLRSVELRRDKDEIGRSFTFVINGVPVFAKGADVIPFDNFTPRVTPARHREILEAARDAHMNMVREWGGGYYESDDFYDIADELGIMVWQEFMFGGEMVPGGTAFRENVQKEAVDQVMRLHNHPSLVLWCGNNEIETGWDHWSDRQDFKKTLTSRQQQTVWQDYLLVMHGVLQSVVATLDPEVPFTPSSPHAEYDTEPDVQTDGDMHYWQVWGNSTPIAAYKDITPRFMSEYGFQSFPAMATLQAVTVPEDLRLDSPVMQAHQKNTGGNERIKHYMEQEYPTPRDFAAFVYVSQVQQAEAIRTAAEHLRSSRPRTMGSMYWQLNDVWPGPSWSSIDYYGRWKALHFYAKKFYADLLVVPDRHDGVVDTTLVSDLQHAVEANLEVTLMDFAGHQLSRSEHTYKVPAASAVSVSHVSEAALLQTADRAGTVALFTLRVGGEVVSARTLYFAPVKELHLPPAKIETTLADGAAGTVLVTLRSEALARNVALEFKDPAVKLSDSFFDLLPGRPVTITVSGSAGVEAVRRAMTVRDLQQAF